MTFSLPHHNLLGHHNHHDHHHLHHHLHPDQVHPHPLPGCDLGTQWHPLKEDDRSTGEAFKRHHQDGDELDDDDGDSETNVCQVPESIKNYVLVIIIIAGFTFVLRLIVIVWRMFRSVASWSILELESWFLKVYFPVQSIQVQSDYKVQGLQEDRICPSVRLSDPNVPK